MEQDDTRAGRPDATRPGLSDDEVHGHVIDALSVGGFDTRDVSVHVEDGHVTLQGSVSDTQMKNRIAAIVGECAGVTGVSDGLGIASAAGGGRRTDGPQHAPGGSGGVLGDGVSATDGVSVGGAGERLGSGGTDPREQTPDR